MTSIARCHRSDHGNFDRYGVVLEKLVEPGELVTPQSFGGTRGPSTALIALADPRNLQVDLDVNESDLAKIELGARCRVMPEAYPDKVYEGLTAKGEFLP